MKTIITLVLLISVSLAFGMKAFNEPNPTDKEIIQLLLNGIFE